LHAVSLIEIDLPFAASLNTSTRYQITSTMKASFTISALVAVAAAQGTTTSAAQTPQQSCLSACTPSDVNCQAICVGVPHPGNAQMDATTDCVANCDQGDGSAEASIAYGKCRDGCISSYIILSGTAAPAGEYTTAGLAATGAAASASASGSAALGMMTTITFLLPVAEGSRTYYEPPFESMTVEVYPYPWDLVDCFDDLDCDGTITLSPGQSLDLPTGRPARPSSSSSSCSPKLSRSAGPSTVSAPATRDTVRPVTGQPPVAGGPPVTEGPTSISISVSFSGIGTASGVYSQGASSITVTYIGDKSTITTAIPVPMLSTRLPSILSSIEWDKARPSAQPGRTAVGAPVQSATSRGSITATSVRTKIMPSSETMTDGRTLRSGFFFPLLFPSAVTHMLTCSSFWLRLFGRCLCSFHFELGCRPRCRTGRLHWWSSRLVLGRFFSAMNGSMLGLVGKGDCWDTHMLTG
jgi:hypothetical protein